MGQHLKAKYEGKLFQATGVKYAKTPSRKRNMTYSSNNRSSSWIMVPNQRASRRQLVGLLGSVIYFVPGLGIMGSH